MKAFMEVEISEAEKTKCDRVFFGGFFGGLRAVRPLRIVVFLGVFFGPPGPCGRFASFSNLEDVDVYFLF